MATKHKVLKDFQLLTEDKKILILKAKTIIEDYKFKTKTDIINVPVDIIRNNPEYFSYIDWKEELQTYLKTNKIAQPAVITKKLVPFIEYLMDENGNKEVIVEKEVIKEITIEKPKIVEKEVVVEKIVSDDSQSIELESKIKKLKLKEDQLDKEIEETNRKELEVDKKAKDLQDKEIRLNKLEIELKSKESKLSDKETFLTNLDITLKDKESNLSSYITRSQIEAKISEYESKGFSVEFFRNMMREV